jgi:hypothetical protein
LELIFGVALGREKLDDFEWTIHFSQRTFEKGHR